MKKEFPHSFFWGGATSNVQAEGGYLEDGKGLNVYDSLVIDYESGQTSLSDTSHASDHYHRYKEDIALMKEMGFNAYRFSIVWSRIHPLGEGETNQKGLDYYEDMIDELLKAGIEPVVSLVHFDMPEHLSRKYNGFASREVVDFFEHHVRVVVERFKDKVKYWITYNEINNCLQINRRLVAGAVKPEGVSMAKFHFTLLHHSQLAHAKAVLAIKEKIPHAKVMGMDSYHPFYPQSSHPLDIQAARFMDHMRNLLPYDVMTFGEYPSYYVSFLENRGVQIDVPKEELDEIYQASTLLDYLALSYYQSDVVKGIEGLTTIEMQDQLLFGQNERLLNPHVDKTIWNWHIDPMGLRVGLADLYERYHKPLYIVENGIGLVESLDENNEVHDDERIRFYQNHLNAIKEAMYIDGVEVIGYLAWAPFDFLSSHKEMRKRYGFIFIDRYDDGTGTFNRYRKKSFYWYKKVIASHGRDLTNE